MKDKKKKKKWDGLIMLHKIERLLLEKLEIVHRDILFARQLANKTFKL